MSKYQPYPAYKDSGIEWLRQVPEHWVKGQFRNLIKSISNGTTKPQIDENDNTAYVSRIETISKGIIDYKKVGYIKVGCDVERFKLVKGDILLSHINSLPMVGNCALYDGSSVLYHGMNLLRLQPANCIVPEWFIYWLKSPAVRQSIESIAKPAINQASVSTDNLKGIFSLLPPLEDQTAIANFLDQETGKMDLLIEKQQTMIALLKEKRQAVISHAVTKGLNPKAPMKDSGIKWLGQIPEHWVISKSKYKGSMSSGDGITNTDILDEGFYEVYGGNGFIGFSNKFNATPPALVIGRVGALCGNVRQINQPKFVSDNALIFKLNNNVHSDYMDLVLKAANLNELNTSSAQPLITSTKVMNFPIPFPPESEQKEIVDYLNIQTQKIDTLIEKSQQAIALLKERKTALISAAVTGKIDVRGTIYE